MDPAIEELTARLYRALGRLARVLRQRAPSALGPGAIAALATLHREGPMRASDLAAREGVRPSTMTRMVAGLEDGGYIARTVDPADRRASLIEITPSGNDVLVAVRTARAGELARHIAELGPRERRALVEALPVLEALAGIESTVD